MCRQAPLLYFVYFVMDPQAPFPTHFIQSVASNVSIVAPLFSLRPGHIPHPRYGSDCYPSVCRDGQKEERKISDIF